VLSGLPPPRGREFQDRSGWTTWLLLAIPVLFFAGVAIRLWLLPARGLVGDIDQFVLWVHGIAVNGWDRAYDQNLSFPAVMAWVWGALAAIEPAFRTVTDSADPGIRSLMKIPASLADLGIAAAAIWWFRDQPKLALLAAGAILLWPATWYVSAWWGQYESIYVLGAVLALLAARGGLPLVTAALLAVSLMTKPQALPFLVPFGAWFLATQGIRGTLKAAAVGAVVVVLLWLPFIAAGGPGNYLNNLATYQNEVFPILSLKAWNPWALLQELGANGQFVSDRTAAFGPVTFRVVGYVVAAVFALIVFVAVYRRPTADQLALGIAAISLAAFVSLTTMHERYAYPALVFLLLALGRPAVAVTWVAFAITFLLNLVVAVPPEGWSIPAVRTLTIVGSVAMIVIAVGVTILLVARGGLEREPRVSL
jgi:hypothetical protein